MFVEPHIEQYFTPVPIFDLRYDTGLKFPGAFTRWNKLPKYQYGENETKGCLKNKFVGVFYTVNHWSQSRSMEFSGQARPHVGIKGVDSDIRISYNLIAAGVIL